VSAVDEDPLFDDDWDASLPLYPASAAAVGDVPAITLLVAAVGENVFFDPTREEMAVADCVLAVSVDWDGRVVGLRTLESGTVGEGGVKRRVVKSVVEQCGAVGKEVFESLEGIVKAGF
jgi:exosome complex component RRP42